MKFLLFVFYMIVNPWPMPPSMNFVQMGPFESDLACQQSALQAELIVRELGAERVGSFCSGTREANFTERKASATNRR